MNEWLGRLLGIDRVESIEAVSPAFAAEWAQEGPAWLIFGCLALYVGAFMFYLRFQLKPRRRTRMLLAALRGSVLALLLLFLAEPVAMFQIIRKPQPAFWVLVDGTDSMSIRDELPSSEASRLRSELEMEQELELEDGAESPSRMDYVRALLRKGPDGLLSRLDHKFRLRLFQLDRAEGVRTVDIPRDEEGELDLESLVKELRSDGQVTALGAGLIDLRRRNANGQLAGALVISDFDQNAGPPAPVAARDLGVPVSTLGVGPSTSIDLGIDLRAPLVMKKDERSLLPVVVKQSGLEGRVVDVVVKAREILDSGEFGNWESVGEESIHLLAAVVIAEIAFTPETAGQFEFLAEVSPQDGEVVDQNNRSSRRVQIRDDFLRTLFVAHEPSWEWRFIKEVFHRDRLVGMRGFRTFLRSADPKVRQSNELFLPNLTSARSEFFKTDVIFIGDMPAIALSVRFCEMLREFVSQFGGGVVFISGPRFGPGELMQTPLVDMLPVLVDGPSRSRDDKPFRLRLTPEANQYDFMQLGEDEKENRKAWENIGELPWYQPISRIHPLTTVLAEHPENLCVDDKTPQPLIAIRRYGRGEVVYLGFNETWRLRRRYGELYYRQFWGQMIHRLGLSHALGSQKRFVVSTDRTDYAADDTVTITVEAYDRNFQPLTEEDVPGSVLNGELIVSETGEKRALRLPQLREGVFEARVPVYDGGEYRVSVRDPVSAESSDVEFMVTDLSVERRSAVRNAALEAEIASASHGRNYDLVSIDSLPEDIEVEERIEMSIEIVPLWNTWLSFVLVVGIMLLEWLLRKLVHLT